MSSASTGGTEGSSSPASSPASATSQAMSAPKYGTLVPNRIFVGGISPTTSEAELAELFSTYGNVKATKIIADRAGVSKGYGFVTFETEEEAKRLQQESECIVLRERKLNIAPAIKKQPFNRSFDGGSGSPPAVPTSPYYYANGMGLSYQNGLTFYNTGAPAPGTPLAPPADPTAIYQAAGVFGPQAASAHQTFAPMMYPCPAPSLYMPQQYQYSPMPYESYYPGAAGTQPYLYASSNTTNNGNPNSGGGGSSGNNPAGATSPPTNAPHGLQSIQSGPHYYTPPGPPTSAHHPPLSSGPTPGVPQQLQSDHLYYNFTSGPPHPPPPHQHPTPHGPIGVGDQQLLLYTTDGSCQQPANNSDGQTGPPEDTRSTSSQSDHQSQHRVQSSGNETHVTTTSSTPLIPIMPMKYPLSNRFPNYHPLAIHPSPLPQTTICSNETDESNLNPNTMHCRILYPIYIPNPYNTPSLLPTPTNSFDSQKLRDQNQGKTSLHHQHPNGYNLISTMHQNPYKQQNNNKFSTTRLTNPHNRKNYSTSSYVSRSSSNINYNKSTNSYNTSKHHHSDSSSTRRPLNSDFTGKKNFASTNSSRNHDNNDSSNSDVRNSNDKQSTSPPPAPYSPMTRPLPNFSPPNVQVQQFYGNQGRFSNPNQTQHHQQQRKYGSSVTSIGSNSGRSNNKSTDKYNQSSAQGVSLRSNKFKVNGIMQNNNGKAVEENLGGAGDAQQAVARMPLTPPSTPRNIQDSSQINDACHQMQALTL
ncbi:deleted in azoospermia protein 3-like isoform X1 [Chelonus insularis]|uniref:deleted in azoospermia protein 3-like isoform X1 n=1 Tax=Chelonus insularis TaxID=460826 RepID=UPI00158A515F|nr:deleted in azoospermia protein 3-like isoform X1 [Chelonus insularis]